MSFRVKSFKYWQSRGNKFNATRTECQSLHWHNSGLEAKTCNELRYRKLAGEFADYQIEKTQRLYMDGVFMGTYRVDFVVEHHDGTIEFVEAKGLEGTLWKRNWTILQHMHKDDGSKFTVVKA